MKIFWLILFLFSGVTVSACPKSGLDECLQIDVEVSQENESSTEDCCDGFCFCSCCNNTPIETELFDYAKVSIFTSNLKVVSYQILTEDYFRHWQPPKLILI